MKNFDTEFARARDLLKSAQKIVILSHRGPDGDTVGANLGLRIGLKEQWGKTVISACIDPPPRNSDFLPDVNEYTKEFDLSWPDVIVVVDCGAHYMTRFHESKPDLFKGNPPVINLDHHASNDFFGTINIVDPDAAAACEIMYHFMVHCGFRIDRKIATCLLHGLYFDTGSFMHSNTKPDVLNVASELLWKGADFKTIVRSQFHTMPISQLKVYGGILERAHVNDKRVTISTASEKDYIQANGSPDDTGGAIDYLNWIPEGDFCCLIHEDRKGNLKGSLRSRVDDIDLTKVAGLFGGGGHKKASGFSMPGRLIEKDGRITIGE